MAHQRGHREQGDLEVGVANVFQKKITPHVAPQPERPQWLESWEAKRPRWLMECLAEFTGVFIYCYGGMGASAAFFTTSAAKEQGFGSLLNIGFCYMLAITLAITICGPTSGPHLNPCFTIAFATFKGFPWRKVPQYIACQIAGGMFAGLVVYGIYRQPLHEITEALTAAGAEAQIFSPLGPAFPFALFKGPTQGIGYVFLNEFVGAFIIGVLVFSVLDPSNAFAAPTTAPVLIGASYFAVITGFAPQSVSLNTARDLGGRLAAACIWGRRVFPTDYTALATFTNIAATLCAGLFQILILSDSTRPHVHGPPPATPGPALEDLPFGPSVERDSNSGKEGHTQHLE